MLSIFGHGKPRKSFSISIPDKEHVVIYEACALYKKALDKYLPPDYSRVVFSPSSGDGGELKALYISEDEEKKIRKDFIRKNEKPKILIVTEKLLTGFDAPILYCMYLDNPCNGEALAVNWGA